MRPLHHRQNLPTATTRDAFNWLKPILFSLPTENVTGSISVPHRLSLSRAVQTKNGYKYMNVRLIEFIFVLPMMRPLRPLRLVPLLFLSLCVFWFVTLVQVTVNLLYIFFCVIFFSFHRAQFVWSNRIRQPSQNIVVWASFLFTLIIIEFSVKHT